MEVVKQTLTFTRGFGMVEELGENLLGQAWAISSLGKAHTEIAARHRQAAAALRSGKRRSLTFGSHFRDWLVASEVRLARAHGISWAEIGEAFGISRQAAWERFERKERTNRSQPMLRASRAHRADVEREVELRRRKLNLVRELSDGDFTEYELAALERVLDVKAAPRTER